ncbi:MAG TPA: transposase [candidate division Zixibacteria bacterium]|nr:transposase [candidate division Zixibacteria bacterium]
MRGLEYNLLFRWFLDMEVEEAAFDHSTFSKNRQRLIGHDIATEFFSGVIEKPASSGCCLMSTSPWMGRSLNGGLLFTVLGSTAGSRPREVGDGTGMVDFRGEEKSNQTHESSTDPLAAYLVGSAYNLLRMAFAPGHRITACANPNV